MVVSRVVLGRHLERAADALYAFRDQKRALAGAGAWCLAGHVILAGSLALSGSVLLPALSSVVVSVLSLLAFVANALPITPGGIGVGEVATEALFRSIGTAGGAMLLVTWRAGTATICVLGGLLFLYQPLAFPRVASPEAPP
jgi:uncharacterized membrane protein YbhN (UPF0104 family)